MPIKELAQQTKSDIESLVPGRVLNEVEYHRFGMKYSTESMRAAIYARVSSDQQTEAGTIASQIAALEERPPA